MYLLKPKPVQMLIPHRHDSNKEHPTRPDTNNNNKNKTKQTTNNKKNTFGKSFIVSKIIQKNLLTFKLYEKD